MSKSKMTWVALSIAAGLWSTQALANPQLSTLADIEAALERGATVSVAVDLTRCAPSGSTTRPGTTRGGLKISS